MANARKLPSGSYRCQVFAGYDFKDGKKIRKYESFTAPTKREAEAQAAIWAANKKSRPTGTTVGQAIDRYIESKKNVLSPSTIRGYQSIVARFDSIADTRIKDLTDADVQLWISRLSADYTPKSVSNTHGLFTAAIDFASPGTKFKVTLPAKEKPDYHLPTDDELQAVLDHVEGKPLWIALMLARYYSLRRSEICALKRCDLDGDVLTIRRAMIKNTDGEWITKERPKTYGSYRYVVIDEPLLSAMQAVKGSYMNGCNPDALRNRLNRAIRAAGVEPFGIHSLRHLFATKAALAGVPDTYTAQMGGWRQGSRVLKEVYQNVQDEDLRSQMRRLNAVMQHEMQHEKEKTQ